MLCTNIVLNVKTKTKEQFLYTTCCELVFFEEFNEQSLIILWLTDVRMRASEKDLPVFGFYSSTNPMKRTI